MKPDLFKKNDARDYALAREVNETSRLFGSALNEVLDSLNQDASEYEFGTK